MTTSNSNTCPIPMPSFDKFQLNHPHSHPSIITNWSKTHMIGQSSQVVSIFSEQQLAITLKQSDKKIRAFGSKLSYQPISQQDSYGILIDLQLQGIVSQSENLIEVYGGTTLKWIFQYILGKNKMLKDCPGVISIQTIAGAICTGTHGQGIRQSTISDSVVEVTVVDAKGNIKQISQDNEYFGAYLTSLGCLGIITRVKLALVDNQIYHCKKVNSTFDYLINSFERLTEQKIQTKAWWFPWTDEVQIWYMDKASEQNCQSYISTGKKLFEVSQLNRSLESTINLVKTKMARDTKDEADHSNNLQVLSRFEVVTDVVGDIYQIMNKGIPIPQINCEIAVDISKLKPLLLRLREWFSQNKQSLHYPFILRPTGKSKSWMSSTYDRVSLHVGFLVYVSEDGSYVKGSLDLLKEIERIIVEFGGKPHMGKKFCPELYNFEERYEKWGEFKDLMMREDPNGRFRNGFWSRLFNEDGDMRM